MTALHEIETLKKTIADLRHHAAMQRIEIASLRLQVSNLAIYIRDYGMRPKIVKGE